MENGCRNGCSNDAFFNILWGMTSSGADTLIGGQGKHLIHIVHLVFFEVFSLGLLCWMMLSI